MRRLVPLLILVALAGLAAWAWSLRAAPTAATPPSPTAAAPVLPTTAQQAPAPTVAPAADAPAPAEETADLPLLDPAAQELHGSWNGERFWARLRPADKAFGGKRVLELVYQPPAPADLGGAVLIDCPFVLLDRHARVAAWNGRDGLSRIDPWTAAGGYHVSRELHDGVGEDASPHAEDHRLVGAPAWDLRLAPLLTALAWRPEGTARVRVLDLFAARAEPAVELRWQAEAVTCGAASWRVEAGADGRLQRLLAADGTPILSVEGRP